MSSDLQVESGYPNNSMWLQSSKHMQPRRRSQSKGAKTIKKLERGLVSDTCNSLANIERTLLPLKSYKSSTPANISILIRNQAEILGVADWEINNMLELCTEKNCLTKGLEILREYASLYDKINSLMLYSNSKKAEVIKCIREKTVLVRVLAEEISAYVEINVKIIVCLNRLRKLQWCPKPFMPKLNSNFSERYCISSIIKNDAYEICRAAEEVSFNLPYSGLHPFLLTFVLLPTQSENSLEIHLQPSESNTTRKFENIQRKQLEFALRAFLDGEGKFDQMCKGIFNYDNPHHHPHTMAIKSNISFDFIPSFRFIYNNVKPPTDSIQWLR